MFRFAACISFARAIALLAVLAVLPALGQTAQPAAPAAAPELRVFDPSLIDNSVDPCENFYQLQLQRLVQAQSTARRPGLLRAIHGAL